MTHPIVHLIAGARPNFMKLAPVVRAIVVAGRLEPRIVHTGQHYDPSMSDVFFAQLGIPEPHVHLEVGSGSHGVQTARILERYEACALHEKPAATVVFGDVNSTISCALAAAKIGIRVAHVEAGLRSRDRSMPEEINRILTDAIADLLLVSEPSGLANLAAEGVSLDKIKLVGNVMIDTLMHELPTARTLRAWEALGVQERAYGLVTLHRPSNVDDPIVLGRVLSLLLELSSRLPLVLPLHPRTRASIEHAGLEALLTRSKSLIITAPLPYRQNLSLMSAARVVLTDSGGMQEETGVLGIPCLTMRENTERPITLELGTSRLVGNDVERIRQAFEEVLGGRWPQPKPIPLWDGRAAERVAHELAAWLLPHKSVAPRSSARPTAPEDAAE